MIVLGGDSGQFYTDCIMLLYLLGSSLFHQRRICTLSAFGTIYNLEVTWFGKQSRYLTSGVPA